MEIDRPAIEAELERILTSRCFRACKMLSQFLRYIVWESLAGKQTQITQYAIAIHALGRPTDFSALENPLVRVQARRLRDQLGEYYATEGRFDTLRIDLPMGSYCPEFSRQHPVFPLELANAVVSQSQGPSITCIPRHFVTDASVGNAFITRLTDDYVAVMAHFRFCQVTLADAAQRHDVWHSTDFNLFFDLYPTESGYSLKCSLVHGLNRQIVWAHSFALDHTYPALALHQQIFKRIAHDTVGAEKGIAQDYWVRQLLDSGKPIRSQHQVLVTFRQYCSNISHDNFRTTLRACEQRLEQFPDDIPALIMFADHCRGDYLLKYHEIERLHARTAQTVERLLQLAPNNAYTHLFQAMSYILQEEYGQCADSITQAQAINPLDSHLNNLAGLIYIGLGQWERGAALIQDCINISPIYPDWYHIPLCVYHYHEGRYLAAAQEAKKIKLKHLWSTMLRTALYHQGGWQEKGKQEYQHLTQTYPKFAQDSHKLAQGFSRKNNQIIRHLWSRVTGNTPAPDDQ
ncbi:MAG: hypothetical protein L3K52_09615 [Candidatus Thiothrix sulfatifontis]|nr:MAG: hypothetical protein L3K52_09615 [Candidatus Thiothrix sulfatifontis]